MMTEKSNLSPNGRRSVTLLNALQATHEGFRAIRMSSSTPSSER